MASEDLLLEIGVEELPAGFVSGALAALPALVGARLAELRLAHGEVRALGTPRRLALIVDGVATHQPDLDEEVLGPPARVAFDAEGRPTRAAESFASKLGVALDALTRVTTPKGDYVAARRRERGAPALELLPAALARLCGEIPFRKSMRWAEVETPFGRPVRWLVALLGTQGLTFEFAGVTSGTTSQGHRFLGSKQVPITSAAAYVAALRAEHVVVDERERAELMQERLVAAARSVGVELIGDEFLIAENLHLCEEPQVVVGGFDADFLQLPERVILDVAKGHQRYFGVRAPDGRLANHYLAVVNTALAPDKIRRGNDTTMRARLSDASFFWRTDLETPLGDRGGKLDGVMFQKRLGSVGDKVRRIQALLPDLAAACGASGALDVARRGAALAKCDLLTLMVGELPELQGEMGHAYALAQGVEAAVADVISEHYLPRGAEDAPAPSAAGALVALADRLDTLTGCFAIGITPSGSADPLALRRAALGVLRTLLHHGWDPSIAALVRASYATLGGIQLDLDADATAAKLAAFFKERLRGLLIAELPGDSVDACLAASADHPHDARLRARALAAIDRERRASAGEVFKRAANIARDAPVGAPVDPGSVQAEVPPAEAALFAAFTTLTTSLTAAREARDYTESISAIGAFAPVLERFFAEVFVMTEEAAVRENRLRLMAAIERECSTLASFTLLAG